MISIQTAVILLVAAIAVYALELFIPSAGALFVIGTICLGASLVIAFLHGMTTGAVFLIVICILAAILPGVGLEVWKRSPIGRRMLLSAPQPMADSTTAHPGSLAGLPADQAAIFANLPSLKGEIGKTVTPLRPAGISEIAGRRIDTVSEGVMIEKGTAVRVVDVVGNRVVVRQLTAQETDALTGNVASFNEKLENWTLE